MMTNINNVNDAKFQAMDIKFIVKVEPDKLIVETSFPKDEIQYVGEIPANPFIEFEDIKELLQQKMFKIIVKTEEMLKIKIGATPLEMLPKPKVEANKLKQLQDQLRDSLQKQADLEQTVNSQKDEIILLKDLVSELKNTSKELEGSLRNSLQKQAEMKGQITQLKDLVSQLTNTVSRVESNQNAFETAVQGKLDDFKREIVQQNDKVNEEIMKVQAQFQLALSDQQRSISQNNNRVKIQLQEKLEPMRRSVSGIEEKMRNTEENSRADRTQFERMLQSQKDEITRQNGLITGIKNAVQPLIQQKQMYDKLYQHIQRTISKQNLYYGKQSQKYYNKAVSNKEVEEETIKYINYLKQNIKPLPPQHNEQLLFLIDLFDSQNKCIINFYCIHSDYKDSPGPAKFYLDFGEIKQRIDLKQFLSFNNWNHLVTLSFYDCAWFNDDYWRALVEHAANFNNLKELHLGKNKISAIKEGEIEQFKSLERIDLWNNPLSAKSKQVLKNIQQKNNKITISFDK